MTAAEKKAKQHTYYLRSVAADPDLKRRAADAALDRYWAWLPAELQPLRKQLTEARRLIREMK